MNNQPQSRMAQAVALHQSGRLAEAGALYEKIIEEFPRHFDATHLLGVVALQESRYPAALQLIQAALKLDATNVPAINNLGTVYLRVGDLEEARRRFTRVVELDPQSSSGLTNLGTVLRQLGRPREAIVPLRKARRLSPSSALIANLLGACVLDCGDANEAVELFRAASLSAPEEADGWANLAVALNRVGDRDQALECASRAVDLQPESSAAIAARAAVEFEQGDIDAAIASYREAVALPDPSPQTLTAFANALWTGGQCEEAFGYLNRALTLDKDNVLALWKLAMSQCRSFFQSNSEIDSARRLFAESLDSLQAWFGAAPRPEAYAAVGTTQPFFIAYQPFNNRELLSRYGRVCADWMASMPINARRAPPNLSAFETVSGKSERLFRVGIVSAHIRDHSVWNAITKGWVRHLDKSRFDLTLFHLGRATDAQTDWAKSTATHFEDGPRSLQSWAQLIADQSLDVLVYPEIGMDALTTQLASLRLAPVQAASWGHPETSGLPTIDLYLSADGLEPPNARDNYAEHLVRLPNLGVCLEPLTPTITMPNLAALGLPEDEPLLLCPGTPYKYSPMSDRIWAGIAKGLSTGAPRGAFGKWVDRLRGKTHGRLVFFRSGNPSMDQLLVRRLRAAFEAEGVDFAATVCLIPYLDRPQFFGLMSHATLLLDTIEFSGFNNTLQAIEAGLPVLAYEGRFLRGRLASGILRRMELPGLIANSEEEYIQAAVRLACDPSACLAWRHEIAQRRGKLFNDIGSVRALENLLIAAVNQRRG